MKANADKFHFLVSAKVCRINVTNKNKFKIEIRENDIESSLQEKLLGVISDALARISSFYGLPKRRVITKAYIDSQFGYCPLVWMIHSQSINNKIKRIYERALRIVYKDKFSTFENILENDKAVKIHVRNLQILVTEMYTVKNRISPKIISDIFKLSNPTYNLRNKKYFVSSHVETVYFGIASLSYLQSFSLYFETF